MGRQNSTSKLNLINLIKSDKSDLLIRFTFVTKSPGYSVIFSVYIFHLCSSIFLRNYLGSKGEKRESTVQEIQGCPKESFPLF